MFLFFFLRLMMEFGYMFGLFRDTFQLNVGEVGPQVVRVSHSHINEKQI